MKAQQYIHGVDAAQVVEHEVQQGGTGSHGAVALTRLIDLSLGLFKVRGTSWEGGFTTHAQYSTVCTAPRTKASQLTHGGQSLCITPNSPNTVPMTHATHDTQ